jgi:hypothetical protein
VGTEKCSIAIAVAVVSGSDVQATALSGASLVESQCTGDVCSLERKRETMCRWVVAKETAALSRTVRKTTRVDAVKVLPTPGKAGS